MAEYDPLTGENYDQDAARQAWNASMSRANHQGPKWVLRGLPPQNGGTGFYWSFFDFRPITGRVTVEPDGFHWATYEYHTGELVHSGVTTSVFEVYQSVIQNRPVSRSEVGA
jgi:hypothetical protein